MVTAQIFDHAVRRRSFEILAGMHSRPGQGPGPGQQAPAAGAPLLAVAVEGFGLLLILLPFRIASVAVPPTTVAVGSCRCCERIVGNGDFRVG
jgi:hypothetical protein